jgi:hypothetical protein
VAAAASGLARASRTANVPRWTEQVLSHRALKA